MLCECSLSVKLSIFHIFSILVITTPLKTTSRYGAALAFLAGESPDTCHEDPACDEVSFPFWQVADPHCVDDAGDNHDKDHEADNDNNDQEENERVKENSNQFRRIFDKINESAASAGQQRKQQRKMIKYMKS